MSCVRGLGVVNDLNLLQGFLSVQLELGILKFRGDTLADVWERTVDQWGDKPAVIFREDVWSFTRLDRAGLFGLFPRGCVMTDSNQLAHWLNAEFGLRRGDVVALYMANRPEFIMTWLAMAKLGVTTAFLNHNLRGGALEHCVNISEARLLIFDAPLNDAVHELGTVLEGVPRIVLGNSLQSDGLTCERAVQARSGAILSAALEMRWYPTTRPTKDCRAGVSLHDPLALVYTSGTTGPPKAATISHSRFFVAACLFSRVFWIYPHDRIYTVLPLYHSAGGLLGTGCVLYLGCTMVLREKLSISRFWDDVVREKVTVVQYIGELCRFLANAPEHPLERSHSVRLALGNGLRPDVWNRFQDRFGIPRIGEFYASTEGNAGLFNFCCDRESRGAVGRMGFFARMLGMMPIVRFDEDEEVPRRNESGWCEECDPSEAGELLSRISSWDPVREFGGYWRNPEATEKKIIANVFRRGDRFFRTGDLLRVDRNGYYHFVDRIGDTFRWKGENVATMDVEGVVSLFPGIQESIVYGTHVPGHDGRAGMAAVVLDEQGPPFDFGAFAAFLQERLPAYAVPVFLRFLEWDQAPTTGTFKRQKRILCREGIDVERIQDPIFVADLQRQTYIPLTATIRDEIEEGVFRI